MNKRDLGNLYLLLGSLIAGNAWAGAPALNYSDPLVINTGGTYTGNFRSISGPAIQVNTSAPVIIQNCTVVGPNTLIFAGSGTHITVKNCNGYGEGSSPGPFVETSSAISIDVENNYVEHTSKGLLVYQFAGSGSTSETIRFIGNIGRNMFGPNNPSFMQFNKVNNKANIEIAYNQMINMPYQSSVGDNFNFYDSSGTVDSPINFHDNYVQGAYPLDLNSSFVGTGMTTDGSGDPAVPTGHVRALNNIFLSTCDAGMNMAGGSDIRYSGNHVITSGMLPDGSGRIPDVCLWAGMASWNYFNVPAGSPLYANNSVDNNTVAYYKVNFNNPSSNRQDFSSCPSNICSNNIQLPSVSLDTEKAEWARWNTKLAQAGKTIGSVDNSNNGNQVVAEGTNPFWGAPAGGTAPNPGTPTPTPTPVPAAAPVSPITPMPAPIPSVTVPAISSLTLINASTNNPQPLDGIAGHNVILGNNTSFNLFATGQALNIRADISGVGSVFFNYDNGALNHVENMSPYALASDSSGVYNSWTPSVGTHILKVTAYSGSDQTGTAGASFTVQFSVVNSNVSVPPVIQAPPPPTPTPTPAPNPNAMPTLSLALKSVNSGKCLDILNNSTADGASLIQYSCNGQVNQAFNFVPTGPNRYQIKSKSSGKCLEIQGASTVRGAFIKQYTCSATTRPGQIFSVMKRSDGSISIISVNSNKCVDVTGVSKSNLTPIQQWDCNGQTNQNWQF